MEKIKGALCILCVTSLFFMMLSFVIGVICSIWDIDFIISEVNLVFTFLVTTIFFGVILLTLTDDYE